MRRRRTLPALPVSEREACAPREYRPAPTLPRPPRWAMHYPHLVSTMGVSAGMIAIGAVLSDWPSGSAPLQSYQHVLDELPYPLVMRVSHGLECGSHAAAPAVLTIRRVVHRYPSWSRGCWMGSCRSSSRSGMNELPARRPVVEPGLCLRTSSHGQHLTAVAMIPARGLEGHGEHLQPGLRSATCR